jgi:hypothetical protein
MMNLLFIAFVFFLLQKRPRAEVTEKVSRVEFQRRKANYLATERGSAWKRFLKSICSRPTRGSGSLKNSKPSASHLGGYEF